MFLSGELTLLKPSGEDYAPDLGWGHLRWEALAPRTCLCHCLACVYPLVWLQAFPSLVAPLVLEVEVTASYRGRETGSDWSSKPAARGGDPCTSFLRLALQAFAPAHPAAQTWTRCREEVQRPALLLLPMPVKRREKSKHQK